MNKNIADYLPYYIGQEVAVTIVYDDLSEEYSGIKKLTHILISDAEQGIVKLKLLLRPLSSMTEEGAREVVNRQFKSWVNPIYEGHSSLCIDVKFPAHEPYKFTYTQIDYDRISPDAFHYLLKQGFDLFGLIEANLAVDKTKEVKNG